MYSVQIRTGGSLYTELGPLELHDGQIYEKDVDIILSTPGENQTLEFLLFKSGDSEVYRSLHLYIDVIE